ATASIQSLTAALDEKEKNIVGLKEQSQARAVFLDLLFQANDILFLFVERLGQRLNGRGGERRLDRALANFLEASSEQGGGVADLGFTRGEQLGSLAELGTAPFDLGADLAAPGFFAQRFVFELGDLACSRDQGFLLALDCGFEGADFRLEFSQLGFLVAQKSFFEKRELNEALPSLAQLFDFQNDGLGSFLDLGE